MTMQFSVFWLACAASARAGWSATEEYFAETIGRSSADRRARAERLLLEFEAATRNGESLSAEATSLAAAAMGTLARLATPSESLSQRFGSRSKKLLTDLRAKEPTAAWPRLLEGVWHYEVVRRGGMVGAALLQASVASGDQLLSSAAEQMASSPAAPFAHAVAMWSMDPARFREPARKLIDEAIKRAADAEISALVETIRIHARALKEAEAAGDLAALQRKALSIM